MNTAVTVLTLALVVITGYYAWQNRNMVSEMRLARIANTQPHVTLCFEALSPTQVMVGLVNLGPGAALAIDIELTFHPRPEGTFAGECRRWRGELLVAGAQREFLVPVESGSMMSITRLAECVRSITADGTMQDVLGATHRIRAVIDDIDEWDEVLRQAHERYARPALEQLVKETEKLSKAVTSAVSKWSASGGGLHVRTDADLKEERATILAESNRARGRDAPSFPACTPDDSAPQSAPS